MLLLKKERLSILMHFSLIRESVPSVCKQNQNKVSDWLSQVLEPITGFLLILFTNRLANSGINLQTWK